MATPFSAETVEYQILIQASKAIEDLQILSAQATSFNQKINMAKASVQQFSAQTGLSVKNTVSVFREMDGVVSQLSGTNKTFGDLGKEGWNQVGASAEANSKKVVRGVDAMRIALGVLVSMLIFQVIQAFQNAFGEAINNIKETELATYNLINAERRLSQQGIDVTPKGLQETIDNLQKLIPILSKIQAQELVSRIATNVAPALHLTDEEIRKMSESVALLYVRNKALGLSFDEVEKSVTDAFLTGKVSQGINKLGVKLSDQIVKDEAVREGLVKNEKEFDNLTGDVLAHVKAVAMLNLVYKNAQEDVGSINEYMDTTDASLSRASTAWSNFLTVAGKIASPLLKEGAKVFANALEVTLKILEAIQPELIKVTAGIGAYIETTKNMPQYFKLGGAQDFFRNFQDNFKKMSDAMRDIGDVADTPTMAIDNLQQSLDDFDAEGFKQKVEDIIKNAKEAAEDLKTSMNRKLSDLDKKYVRKAEDAQRDLQRKISDINADAERRKADALRKSREDDLKAERDYQNKLWELRMRYLMDLEDALHARDARQIIRLQKQYAIDKEALLRKKHLDDTSRKEDLAAELAQIEEQRQQKIADAQREYEQKLADQREAKQRELDDLNLWYAREQADQRENIRRKLQDLIKGWIDEGKITANGAAKVYEILRSYFGPGGLTDQLYAYMNSQLRSIQYPSSSAPYMNGYSGSGLPQNNTSSSQNATGGSSTVPSSGAPFFAEGGTLIATRPTTATFGEVPEAVTFTPLSGQGNNIGKTFGDKSAMGGGTLEVLLTLSPDLESRIVKKSLSGVADVLVKVNRSKV